MNIKEKSKLYAEGKALEAITTAIEQAYEAGYNDGLKHYENNRLEAIKDGVEYVDLNLESGTLWSSTYISDEFNTTKMLSYLEASILSLPTKEQFEELCSKCAMDLFFNRGIPGIRFTGTNGKKIDLNFVDVTKISTDLGNGYIAFWLKDDEGNPQKSIARVCSNRKMVETKFFMGYKLPVMLVRKK